MQNTAAKKRAGQEEVDSDYLFANSFEAPCLSFNAPPAIFSPVGPFKSIDVEGHEEAGSRQSEYQRTSRCFIFVQFVVHGLSPNHSGCEEFSCECYGRHLFWFGVSRKVVRKPTGQKQARE